jgi:hypothetical protein
LELPLELLLLLASVVEEEGRGKGVRGTVRGKEGEKDERREGRSKNGREREECRREKDEGNEKDRRGRKKEG